MKLPESLSGWVQALFPVLVAVVGIAIAWGIVRTEVANASQEIIQMQQAANDKEVRLRTVEQAEAITAQALKDIAETVHSIERKIDGKR